MLIANTANTGDPCHPGAAGTGADAGRADADLPGRQYPRTGSAAVAARSYAFRIETAGRTIVYTGDSGPSAHLTTLTAGCDLLVSEVIDMQAMAAVLARAGDIPPAARAPRMAHMVRDHFTPKNVARFAAAAGAKRVVLIYLPPGMEGETSTAGYNSSSRNQQTRVI